MTLGLHSPLAASATVAALLMMSPERSAASAQSSGVARLPAPFQEAARQVEQDLASSDPTAVAWDAYHAGIYRLSSTIPLLQRVLESPPTSDARVRRALEDVVLDALIQLTAAVPASLVDRFVDVRPVQAFALLAHATGREPILVDRLQTALGIPWFAMANILLPDRSQGFTLHLLSKLRLRLRIYVSDDANRSGVGGGLLSGGVADGIGENTPGFPPHAEYRFESAARPGFIVLATGPRPVYYSRTVTAERQYAISQVWDGGPTDRDRLEYLGEMLGMRILERVHWLQAETGARHRWTTAESLLQHVEELRAEIRRKYEHLIGELVQRDLLRADVAPTLTPHIEVEVVDQRNDKSVPLPVVREWCGRRGCIAASCTQNPYPTMQCFVRRDRHTRHRSPQTP